MKLVILTKPTFFVEEDKILTSLFDEGLDNLHLCKPASAPLYSERLLTLLSDDAYDKITVHGHFYLKEEYKLRGIHLDRGEDDMPQGYRGHFSTTCHSMDELRNMGRKADYVFLAHTFGGKADADGSQAYSAEELQEAAGQGLIDKRVYAYGGVGMDTIAMAKDLGFGGVVVGDDLWNRFDIHHQQDYKDLMAHFERLRKMVG